MSKYEYYEDEEIEELIADSDEKAISVFLKRFQKEMTLLEAQENELEKLRKKFVEDFPVQKLKAITKEEYAVHEGKRDTFCFRIENELMKLGNIHGAPATKFGLYYGKSGDDTTQKYRFSKKFGKSASADEAMDRIRKELIGLLIAGSNDDYDGIRKCDLAPMYRGKILSVYYPEKYLCIFVSEHLTYFMQKLGISWEPGEDVLVQQRRLQEWMKDRPECKNWRMHDFSNFLYHTFGRPLSEEKGKQDAQDERDREYPTEFVTKVNIKKKQWEEILQNQEIFREEDIALLKRFYKADNHATTCYDLGVQDGVSPSTYIKPIVSLARRVERATGIPPIYNNEGKQVWWRILFWGTYREDKHFEWKLQPKLAKAMETVFEDLKNCTGADIEAREDQILVDELRHIKMRNDVVRFEYEGIPRASKCQFI